MRAALQYSSSGKTMRVGISSENLTRGVDMVYIVRMIEFS